MADRPDRSVADGKAREPQRFFFRVPNIVFELGLSPYELSLYSAIRRTAGDEGICFRSGLTLARLCRMSSGQVSRCKKRLTASFEKLGGKPLIQIVERPSTHGGKPYHEISVVNIWDDNDRYFSVCRSAPTSGRELATSSDQVATSPIETKKTLKRKIKEEEPPSLSPSSRETAKVTLADLSHFWNFLCTIFERTDNRGPTRAEKKLMNHWLPIPREEYDVIEWWMGLEERGYDHRSPVGFLLHRRPRSVRSLLQHWGDVNDIARHYRKTYESRGYLY
jgi:hypothetical protein